MTISQTRYIVQAMKGKGVLFADGLTDEEVLEAERKFDFKFPPDLKQFLQTALPISEGFMNWRESFTSSAETDKITELFQRPLEGFLGDIEYNNIWFDYWGQMPDSIEKRVEIVTKHYLTVPKMIPIYSHRYIPSVHHESGNPVFSVHQTDIIYYGYDLAPYFANEFNFALTDDYELLDVPKEIEFWSEIVQ